MTQQPGQIDYVNLLSGLSDTDAERRKQAESLYNSIPAKDRFSLLGGSLCQIQLPETVRIFAAILLRRLIISCWEEIKNSIPPQQLQVSCNELLKILKNSTNESKEIRDKMCQVIAVLAKSFVNETEQVNQWSEFIQFLFELLGSPQLEHRELGLTVFSSAPDVLGQINNQTAYIDQLHQCFMDCYQQKGRPDSFYITLTEAVCGLIVSNANNKECVKRLSTFAMPLTETLASIGDESKKEEICQHLTDVAEEAPLSLRPAITQILELCINYMASSTGLESDLRFSALELSVSLVENAPAMIKKRAQPLIKPLVLRILAFMSTIEEDPDWYTSCKSDKDDDEPDAIGESALDRVSNALGGKVLLPILMDELTKMLQSPEWPVRHAALMAFSCAGEGCRDQLLRVLDRVVNGILNYLGDPHPRVRHATCNAIGQMATDFSPEFEEKFHGQVIPALCRLLVDFSCIRVQAHSACAMINFFEECPKDVMANYLGMITEHIQVALSKYMNEGIPKDKCELFVIENIIVALSSVADSSAESFVKYYEKFMPCLKFIIKNSTDQDDLRLLRGKAIECVSLIGMAVGKEKFCSDASDIMQMLLATQTGQLKLADDDPQLSYMMGAWARICRILGPDFQSYLPYVMEPVLKAAALKVEIAFLNDEEKAAIEDNDDWESVSVHDQSVGIRTAGLEDKATACSMLVCYARELKHGFADYVEPTAEVLVPLIKFPFHDDVRCAAAEAMPYLLEAAKPKGEQCVLVLWNAIFDNLIAAFDIESDNAIVNQLLDSLGNCIEVVGVASMNQKRYEVLTTKLRDRFKTHFELLDEEYERRRDEDYEAESQCSDEDDQYCLSGIAGVIHSLFVVFKGDYLPYFQPLIEPILKLSEVDDQLSSWSNKQTALCIWDDLIEYGGQNCVGYQEFYLPQLAKSALDKKAHIRQAALYGIGQLAQQTGPVFIEFFQNLIPGVAQMINHPESRLEDNILATENAISAIGRILKYCAQIPNHSELLKCWFEWLPIWEDDTEVVFVIEYLLQLIEKNDPVIMGPNSCNLPRLVAVVAETFARSALESSSEVGLKSVSFLKQVHANSIVNSCFNSLTETQKKAVQEVLS